MQGCIGKLVESYPLLALFSSSKHAVLQACPALRRLGAARCELTSLAGLSACTALRQVDASKNSLACWPTELAGLMQLWWLDLSCNQIPSLPADQWAAAQGRQPVLLPGSAPSQNSGAPGQSNPASHSSIPDSFVPDGVLAFPPMLEVLKLQQNRICALPTLLTCPRLHTLDLSFNSLQTLPQLQALAGRQRNCR